MQRVYMPQLDGIRFFAFFLVFIHHTKTASLFYPTDSLPSRVLKFLHDFGWVGVDLFLVLSGFLITTLLLLEHENFGRISLRDFYIRRTLRIWPLYYLILIVGFVILPLIPIFAESFGSAPHTNLINKYLVPYLTFFGNFAVGNYGFPRVWTLAHLWTIGLEEQFYIVWPALLILLLKLKRQSLVIVTLGLFLATSIALRWHYYDLIRHPFIWASTHTRLDPLVLGVFLAIIRRKYPNPSGGIIAFGKFVLGVTLVACIGLVTNVIHQSIHVVWQYTATAIGFTLIIDSSLAKTGNPLQSFLSQAWLVWLGKLTYGLYMYHLLCIQVVRLLSVKYIWYIGPILGITSDSTMWIASFLVSLTLTVAVSAFSYTLIESYFLRLKGRFAHIVSRPLDQKTENLVASPKSNEA